MEPGHMFHTIEGDKEMIEGNVDEYGDSYCRDVTAAQLRKVFDDMPKLENSVEGTSLLNYFHDRDVGLVDLPGWMFRGAAVFLDQHNSESEMRLLVDGKESLASLRDAELDAAGTVVKFEGGRVVEWLEDHATTHILVGKDRTRLKLLREAVSHRVPVARIVSVDWVVESFREGTRLDEERFTVT